MPIITEKEVIATFEPSEKERQGRIIEEQHKTRNLIAKVFVFSYLIFVGFFLFLSPFDVPNTNNYLSILERLFPIIALIIGFYFGEKYAS